MPTKYKPFRVLIADDERDVADNLALVLHRNGFRAIATYSGESAVEMAAALEPEVLIGSDLFPGNMNGLEAAERILAIAPACRVLLISGHGAIADLKSIRAGHREFPVVQRPLCSELVLNFVRGQA